MYYGMEPKLWKIIDFHDWGKLIFITIFIVLSPYVHTYLVVSSSLGFLRYLYLFAYSKLSQYIFSTWVTKRVRSKILTCCRSFPVFDVLHVCPSLTGCQKQKKNTKHYSFRFSVRQLFKQHFGVQQDFTRYVQIVLKKYQWLVN